MKDILDLKDKDIWVVGGAGYLGRAIVETLFELEAKVLCIDLKDFAQKYVESLEDNNFVTPASLDITREDEVNKFINQQLEERGIPYGIVILSFGSTNKQLNELTGKEFDEVNHTALTSVFLLTRRIGSVMETMGRGSIVLFSSMYGTVSPDPNIYKQPMNANPIEYGVGKAGIVQMAKYFAVFWAKRGVRCNCVSPGPFPHENVQRDNPGFIKRLERKVPMNRIGNASEIAGPVVFLLSEMSSYLTGQNLLVDGGWTIW